MMNQLKKLFRKEKKQQPSRTIEKKLSPKEVATANNEPYVAILTVNLDPNNVNNGSFELDWNDKFILNLIKSGYKMKPDDTDNQIVDRWFTDVCRNVVLEMYEQSVADPEKREDIRIIRSRDIGNGRTEVS